MSINILKTLWGVPYTKNLVRNLPKPYNGFEVAIQFADFDKQSFMQEIKENDLKLITQIHTTGYPIQKYSVQEHFESYKEQIQKALSWNPNMINVHSGVDSWSLDESIQFYTLCQDYEKQLQTQVVHETHRQRAFYSPFQTQLILDQVKDIKLNADISHWILVGERFFQNEPFWIKMIQSLKDRSLMIHARVSTNQQIQIENLKQKDELNYFIDLWQNILQDKQQFYFTCEFGPQPYMLRKQGTNEDIVDLNEINLEMANILNQKFIKKL